MNIREANLDDITMLRKFEQGVIEAERPFDSQLKSGDIIYYDLEQLIADEKSLVVVAENDENLCACGYVWIKSSKTYFKYDEYAYLGFMYVTPEFRGKGIVQLIINYLSDWSKAKGVCELQLDVYDQNEPAIRAYEKLGFRKSTLMMRMAIESV